jgi:hypothetical protein
MSGMRHDDLFAGAHPPQQMRKEVSGVPRVVLREVAWSGLARWRVVATPAQKQVHHVEIVPGRL